MTPILPWVRRMAVTAALAMLTLAVGVTAERTPVVHAASYVVTTLADSGPGSLRQAILDANAAAGADTITFSVSGTIVLTTALPDITDAAGLTMDGTGQAAVVSGNNAVRPFQVAVGASAETRYLTVINGRLIGDGAGILNKGTLSVVNSTFTGNTALWSCSLFGCSGGEGGAISSSGLLTIVNSTLSGNTAAGGGGISSSGTLTVANSTINDNSGGGIGFSGDTLTVTNSTISGNTASYTGGGISAGHGAMTVTNSTISDNSATDLGGGMYKQGDKPWTVTNSTIRGNTAGVGGGIVSYNPLTVTDSTISGNTASGGERCYDLPPICTPFGGSGGGILNVATLTVTNSTISGNSVYSAHGTSLSSGGGIDNNGTLTVTSSTISGNSVYSAFNTPGSGGGISLSPFGTSMLSNSIIAGNSSETAADCTGPLTAAGPNLIGDPTGCTITGTPPITGDPKLGPLADNGGPTQTHALLPGSPAIDAGDDLVCAAAPVNGKDQRGVARPQGIHCDLGAFERQASDPTLLINGDFEVGSTGWTLSGLEDGIARVETEGSCFGANNTLGITMNGTRALNVRSSPTAPVDSTGIATSSPFALGASLNFRALVENDDAIPAPDPVAFEVRILDEGGAVLATRAVKPSILTTSPGTSNDGCLVGDLRDGPWSTHTIDTSAFSGQLGKVEFRQHTNVPGKGFFTLVDDVAVGCAVPDMPILTSATHSGGSHTITWTAPSGGPTPTGYNVYGDSSDPPTTLLNTSGLVLGLTFAHGGGGHNWYGVRAVNGCGTSLMSNRFHA